MFSRHDFTLIFLLVSFTCAAFAVTNPGASNLNATAWDWSEIAVKKTDVGEYRQVVRQPTATLVELEMHITTLNPGLSSHPPHQHVNEELVIIREGDVEVLVNGNWKKIGPGGVIFNSTNSVHALRNVGKIPAVYHVINWTSEKTLELAKQVPNGEKQ